MHSFTRITPSFVHNDNNYTDVSLATPRSLVFSQCRPKHTVVNRHWPRSLNVNRYRLGTLTVFRTGRFHCRSTRWTLTDIDRIHYKSPNMSQVRWLSTIIRQVHRKSSAINPLHNLHTCSEIWVALCNLYLKYLRSAIIFIFSNLICCYFVHVF